MTGESDGAEVVLAVSDGCGGRRSTTSSASSTPAGAAPSPAPPGPDGGAGLGLAIARGIVEAHAGRIAVTNTTAGGRFEVRLPRVDAVR